jgi:hypothetical protein
VARMSKLLALVAGIALVGSLAMSAIAQETPAGEADVPASLAPPASSILLFELAARGEQIYACEADPDDASAYVWTFTAPQAELLNARGEVVGNHFAGPTWQGQDGSAVVGAVLERADAPEAGAIPWLLLEAKSHEGSGAFSTITHVQRLNTVGGVAPAEGCDEAHEGEEARVLYEATYAFYYPAATAGATPAAETSSVTVRVFSCPAELSQSGGGEPSDQAALLAACTPLEASEVAPTVYLLPDGEPVAGTVTEPGVYTWEGVALGDYAIGGSGEMPADLAGLRVTDANGAPLQNPVLRLTAEAPDVEYHYFYFRAE